MEAVKISPVLLLLNKELPWRVKQMESAMQITQAGTSPRDLWNHLMSAHKPSSKRSGLIVSTPEKIAAWRNMPKIETSHDRYMRESLEAADIKYIVFKTTNNITGEWYIGTCSIDGKQDHYSAVDGFLGAGKRIIENIKAYGKENFTRETKFAYHQRESAIRSKKVLMKFHMDEMDLSLNVRIDSDGTRHIPYTKPDKVQVYDNFDEPKPFPIEYIDGEWYAC